MPPLKSAPPRAISPTKKKTMKLKDLLEETKRSFWGADTQTVDKFLTEMELVVPENKKPEIAEPTATELEYLFLNGDSKANYNQDKFSSAIPGIMRKDCRVEKQ